MKGDRGDELFERSRSAREETPVNVTALLYALIQTLPKSTPLPPSALGEEKIGSVAINRLEGDGHRSPELSDIMRLI